MANWLGWFGLHFNDFYADSLLKIGLYKLMHVYVNVRTIKFFILSKSKISKYLITTSNVTKF